MFSREIKFVHFTGIGGVMTVFIAAMPDSGLAATGSKIRLELIFARANGDDGNPIFHAQ